MSTCNESNLQPLYLTCPCTTPAAWTEGTKLIQLLRLGLDILLAASFLLPVLLHPGLERLAGSRIPAGKLQCGYIDIADVHPLRRIARLRSRNDTDHRGFQRRRIEAVIEIPLNLRAVLARHGD